MEIKAKRLYSAITLGAVLVMAFVLAQPTIQRAYAVGVEGLPEYDDCRVGEGFDEDQPEDPVSMNTVRSGNIVKTIHTEKEIFHCFLDQGRLPVIVDVTTYIEIYENIVDREVIETNALATTCMKDGVSISGEDDDVDTDPRSTATVIDCESYDIPTTPVPAGNECRERDYITHPQEMNTVNKGKIAKTVEAQKEVFFCFLNTAIKKVEVILFTDIYEDLETQEVEEVQFHSMRCVVLLTDDNRIAIDDDDEDDSKDATVETCQFSTIQN